jgi:hypothetical protein
MGGSTVIYPPKPLLQTSCKCLKQVVLTHSTVQDATWYYNVTEGNPYKTEQ